jgi:hypothetical protein
VVLSIPIDLLEWMIISLQGAVDPSRTSSDILFRAPLALNNSIWLGTYLVMATVGWDWIAYVTLRRLLARSEGIPTDLHAVLDAACDAALMQRVGDSYRFVHGSLQEHLAAKRTAEVMALAERPASVQTGSPPGA